MKYPKVHSRVKDGDEQKQCDVKDCTNSVKQTASLSLAKETSLSLPKFHKSVTKVHLCREHIRTFKKETKEDRTMDRLSRS